MPSLFWTARMLQRRAAGLSLALSLTLGLALVGPLLAAVLLGPVSGPALAQTADEAEAEVQQSLPGGFTSEQVQGMEQVIRRYLLENPEVLIEAVNLYRQRQRVAQEERQRQAVTDYQAALQNDPRTPVVGNPEGDVVIVEFFDYRCGYCRRVVEDLQKVVEEDGNVRLVMKEFPILGPASIRAARAALASVRQGKYEAYHFALMSQPGDMSDGHLEKVAREVGLDVEQLKADMESEEIDDMIRSNHQLAERLGINGTPAFVFGNTLVPGAVDAQAMRRLIAAERANAS